MKKAARDQVELFKLIFTLNWEDPEMDRLALAIRPGESLMTITSGGCNTLSLLLQDPSIIYTVDINTCQAYLMELKIASIMVLGFEDFSEFTGLKPARTSRINYYNRVRKVLSQKAANFWDRNLSIIEKGFLINGRYEKFIRIVSRFIRIIEGSRRVNNLFIDRDPEDQRKWCMKEWDTARTRFIFNLFFNKHILAGRGLKADYFTFDDGSNSFAESFYKRFRKVLLDVPVRNNYFLHLYLKGSYRSVNEVPDYLQEQNFGIIKERVDRIHIIANDAKKWLTGMPSDSLNCFALSNICELMSPDDTFRLFSEVLRTAVPGARVCFRNLVIPREVPDALISNIVKDEELTDYIFNRDRSFVYSKVAAYQIVK